MTETVGLDLAVAILAKSDITSVGPVQVVGGSITWGASTMTVIVTRPGSGLPASVAETSISYSPGGGGAMMKL